eukprot:CAMPEP_0197490336 /NCGR_PEP_ID=MMETSP1311-20131121/4907_1 /TAXON_ID=464262 /ORGANISM="Genus nov. species nov., Strain RCC856" /LENGTH=668 /DNA_ID=CAMNT_0043034839 /DNA_START=116 /DNA_END=2122 /DNA_ORIENTATION=+
MTAVPSACAYRAGASHRRTLRCTQAGTSSVVPPNTNTSSSTSTTNNASSIVKGCSARKRVGLTLAGGRRQQRCAVVRVFDDDGKDDLQSATAPSSGDEGGASASGSPAAAKAPEDLSLKRTLSDLDAILGVEEEEAEAESPRDEPLKVEFNPEILAKIAQVDTRTGKAADKDIQDLLGSGAGGDGKASTSEGGKELDEEEAAKVKSAAEQIAKIVNEVKQGGDKSSEESLRKEFEKLVDLLKPEEMENSVSREDCKVIKERVFGAETFWVTEIVANDDIIGGMLFKGNLRGEVEEVFTKVEAEIKKLFPERYEVVVIEDPDAEDYEDVNLRGRERICFLLLPKQAATPPKTTATQIALSVLLGGIGVLSCLQVGVGAELFMVPKDILDATLDAGTAENQENLQNLLANYDPVPLIQGAWPIAAAIFGTQVAHDIGHRVVAAAKGIKLGPSYLIPNGQIGLFGSITQFKSLCKTRSDMFDVAYGGLAGGGAIASALFLSGLILSMDQDAANLVPVPSILFQGSVLLGGLAKTFIGSGAMVKSQVMVHPNLIAGWCSMVCTALNALPIGSLDGGRIVQAAYGRRALSISAILTYAGLGFGILGSTLSLPFGLYVLFCQRIPEQYLKNHVTGTDTNRQLFAAAVLLFSVATLLPMAPSDLDIMQASIQNSF